MRPMRGVLMGDKHHGNIGGLTPPGWNSVGLGEPEYRQEYQRMRAVIWDWLEVSIQALGRVDFVVDNGDLVDGKGKRSGGTEVIFPDRKDQVEMAVQVHRTLFPGAERFLSYGTPYHTGEEEDWEKQVAQELNCQIGSEDTIDVRGLLINFKHQVSRSVIPHGRFTPIARDRLWNLLWAERGEYPKADLLLRSHVHYFNHCGEADWEAITLPALQGYGTKYGARRMTGVVDIGFVVIDVTSKTEYTWEKRILRLPYAPPAILRVLDPEGQDAGR